MRRLGQATTWLHADAVRLDNGRMAVGSLGDSPVFGADLRFFRTRRVRSCPPMPAGSRCGTDQGKPGRGEHASRKGGSRPPATLRGLAGGQPLHHPELGLLPPFDLQALGPHLQQQVPQLVVSCGRPRDQLQ